MLGLALSCDITVFLFVFNIWFSAVFSLYLFGIYCDENGGSNSKCYVETSVIDKVKGPIMLLISDTSVGLKNWHFYLGVCVHVCVHVYHKHIHFPGQHEYSLFVQSLRHRASPAFKDMGLESSKLESRHCLSHCLILDKLLEFSACLNSLIYKMKMIVPLAGLQWLLTLTAQS